MRLLCQNYLMPLLFHPGVSTVKEMFLLYAKWSLLSLLAAMKNASSCNSYSNFRGKQLCHFSGFTDVVRIINSERKKACLLVSVWWNTPCLPAVAVFYRLSLCRCSLLICASLCVIQLAVPTVPPRFLTSGSWDVTALCALDETAGKMYVKAALEWGWRDVEGGEVPGEGGGGQITAERL